MTTRLPTLRQLLADAEPTQALARAVAIRLDRAGTELRRGRPLTLRLDATATADGTAPDTAPQWLLAAAVETLSDTLLQRLLQTGPAPQLLLSAARQQALGWPEASAAQAFALPANIGLHPLQQLAAVAVGPGDRSLLSALKPAGLAETSPRVWQGALELCKRQQLVPALLLLPLDADTAAGLADSEVLSLHMADLMQMAARPTPTLRRVSDARVPLGAEEDCTLTLFRELDGGAEHLAVLIGQPPAGQPVPVRLHSACLTGDLLGSLRCDCGPQLQSAVAQLAQTGGVLLYLAQEGRGTGLANKLRAYRLQDTGLDTLQADRHLGFRDDERDFATAAAMLLALGHTRISLLTNNPHKIEALRAAGIEVVGRLPLHGPVNGHNARYIGTKQQAGHLGGND